MSAYDTWRSSPPENPEADAYERWLENTELTDIIPNDHLEDIIRELAFGSPNKALRQAEDAIEKAWRDYVEAQTENSFVEPGEEE